MTPEQALELLDKSVATLAVPRVGHMQLAQALQVLKSVVDAAKKTEDEKH